MIKKIYFIIVFIIVFFLGFLTKKFIKNNANSDNIKQENKINEPLYWVAPMDPSYRRDSPGKSPMGMDLVAVYSEDKVNDNTIKITPSVELNMGVRTEVVSKQNFSRIINTVGYVSVDENEIDHIHTYTEGWVKKLYVNSTGEHVKKNQLLFEFFSPKIVNAEEEYLLALKSDNKNLMLASYKKLLTLGVSKSEINEIKKTKKSRNLVKVFSNQDGIVSNLNVREGEYVTPNKDLLIIEDLEKIWIIGEVFERQSGWVKKSQKAIAKLPYIPNKEWVGNVDYVYPTLDPKTHTLKVRFIFENADEELKPNMYADIEIFVDSIKDSLVIPKSAVIYSGTGTRVVLNLGDGHFKITNVELGFESGQNIQVISGLKEGDKIVTSGQFLIDSESNLKSSFERLDNNTKHHMH